MCHLLPNATSPCHANGRPARWWLTTRCRPRSGIQPRLFCTAISSSLIRGLAPIRRASLNPVCESVLGQKIDGICAVAIADRLAHLE